jgi:hypothetical protein
MNATGKVVMESILEMRLSSLNPFGAKDVSLLHLRFDC